MTALEDLRLKVVKNGVEKTVPALNIGWCEPKKLLEYAPPPLPEKNGSFAIGVKDDWLLKMEIIKNDLEWLLELPHNEFWSNMIFKEDRLCMLVSFLKNAHPRCMLNEFPNDDEMFEIYNSIHYLVLSVFKRLSTIKESEAHYLSMKKFSELIYDYLIFTVPRLMDICLLYGDEYRSVVTEIVTSILEAQPKFLAKDLDVVIKITLKCMRFIQRKFIPSSESNTDESVKKENDTNLPLKELRVVATTLIDLFANMHHFMDIYPSVCEHFHRHSLELRLASFYEAVIPKIYYNLEVISNKTGTSKECENIKYILAVARGYMLETFHHILSWCLHSAIEAGQENGRNFADDYTVILTESLTEKLFIRDYHSNFPIDQDLDMLSQVSPEIEESSQYLLEAVLTNFDVPEERQRKFLEAREKAMKNRAEKVAIDTAILEVKEVLPHLEDAFIQKCLSECQNDSQRVIHAVLESTLPKYLQKLCEQENNVAPIKVDENMPHRSNVFDYDDLDVMHRNDVDLTKIHKGKRKSKHKNVLEMLNDKSHVTELKEKGLFNTLGLTDILTYDDEYDDTYDSLEVAVDDSEEVERRPIVVPRILETRKHVEEDVAPADESEEEEKPSEKPRDAFVSNPEEVRARRNQWYGNRRPANVVGRPKGQGQDKDVTRNRDKKNVNKSTRGNHNRRGGAHWKRSQGMIPS